MNVISLLINGERTQASQGATFERRNPLEGSVATRAPAASVASREDIARTRRPAGSSACRPLGPLPTDGATCRARRPPRRFAPLASSRAAPLLPGSRRYAWALLLARIDKAFPLVLLSELVI